MSPVFITIIDHFIVETLIDFILRLFKNHADTNFQKTVEDENLTLVVSEIIQG